MLNLAEYRAKADGLADHLPWAALVAPGIVLNKDGAFQRTLRYRGPDLDSATEAELVSAAARINNALQRVGSGWALFFEATRHPARAYPRSRFPDLVSQLVDEERRAGFEAADRLFESVYHLTFTFLPPRDSAGRLSAWLIERDREAGDAQSGWRAALDRFCDECDRLADLLTGVLPELAWLDDDETLTYLHACISPHRHPIKAPDIPIYLDAVLPDTPLVGGLAPKLGENNLRLLSVLGYPQSTTPGLLDALNHLGFSYRWMTRWIALDKAEGEKLIKRVRRQWFAKRKSVAAILKEVLTNEQSALVDTDADNKAADADAALQELGADFVAYGYHASTLVLADCDLGRLSDQARAARHVIERHGFAVIDENLNAVEAWLGSLPGHVYANVRQAPISTLNLAHLSPFSASWAGPTRNAHLDGPPLISVRTHGTTPFRLSTHVGDVGHALIVGPTGAGKSVLLALMTLQFRRYPGAQIAIFDKGGSSRASVLAMGGAYHNLGGDTALAFQPLREIDADPDRAFAQDWIEALFRLEGVEVTPEVKDAVWSALESLSAAPQSERTLTGLSALIQTRVLRQALKPYTLEGPYGALLDADSDALVLSDVQAFEMEALMGGPAAGPVLSYLFHRLERTFDGRPSLILLDEAWLFLDDAAFAARLRDWLKTLRKKNVSVIFATQALADITQSSIAPAVIESCPTRLFLPNSRALEPQAASVYEAFGLNARQIEILANATPKQDYYLQSRAGSRLFELDLGPVALAVCAAGSSDDHALIDECLAAAGHGGFAEHWFKAKGLDWASELVAADAWPRQGEAAS